MRLPTEQRTDVGMQFFKPELYLSFNSNDEAVADRANESWEEALRNYDRHLNKLRVHMGSHIRQFSEMCLHDADVLAFSSEAQSRVTRRRYSPVWSAVAVLTVRLDEQVHTLVYSLRDHVREAPAPQDWPFSPQRVHWLYDEFDIGDVPLGGFRHRILLSNGRVIEIPFTSIVCQTSSWSLPESRPVAASLAE